MDLLQTVRKEGSRGGRAEFSWSDVQGDAQRENYLGHSLMAPVGRWQKGRDLNWYAKGDGGEEGAEMSEAQRKKEEIKKIKEREEDEMRKALGLEPIERDNANLMPLGPGKEDKEVQRIIREAVKPDEEAEVGGKGLGSGGRAVGGRVGDEKEVMKGREGPSGDPNRRRRSRSRSHERHHKRSHGEDRPRRRSKSRDREREREKGHRRHRSTSREHRPRYDDRDRDHRARRDHREREREREHKSYHDDRRERPRSKERRSHRSRSPYERRHAGRKPEGERRRYHD